MNKRTHRPERGILICIIVLLCFFLVTVIQADQRDTSDLADETIDFLKTLCQRYDNYADGQDAAELNIVLNKTLALAEFAPGYLLSTQSYVSGYVSEMGLTGVLITDDELNPVTQADITGLKPAVLLAEVLENPSLQNILQARNKTFSQRLKLNGTVYDLAVSARRDASGLVIGYHAVTSRSTDLYAPSLEKALEGNNFHKNPRILITDDTTILATNSDISYAGQPISEFPAQDVILSECDFDSLIRVRYDHTLWYGKRQVFQKYYIYVFYPFTEVFTNMLPMVTSAIAVYALLCMLLMTMRTRAEQRHRQTEEQQIRIIRTLSRLFAGTTLLHLQEDTFENITTAPRQNTVPVEQAGIRQLYAVYAEKLIAPAYRQRYLDFFDTDTMEQRLDGKSSIATVIQDSADGWYSMYMQPMSYDSAGRLKDVLVASRDITDYKQKEEDYQAQLRKTAADAEIASEAKTLFLRRMSHDVRTPINGIRGMAVLAQDSLDDPAAVRGCIDKIITSTDYLHELLEDVLRMSKLESGKIQFEDKPYDLNVVIRETVEFLQVQADEKHMTLTLDTADLQHSRVIGSPLHLRQIMQNILSNAVKFTEPGGKIHVTCRETGCTANTLQFEFVCADTGIGISPEFRPRIFEPFAQEADSARTRYEGTGLGMPIVKELLDQRGGTITVDTRKGSGSTFTVTLPIKLDPGAAAAPAPQDFPASIEGARILLAEDNEINLMVAQSLLEERGAVVTAARDGRQAVDAFAASEPGSFDIILMDLMMPVMDGYEATHAIRTMDRPDAASVPIFAMTANAFVDDIEHCLNVGMNEHIAKPIDLDRMVQVIAKYYHKRG